MKLVKFLAFLTACIGLNPALAQERIVSIGGDVTEIIYALGAEQALVGRDSTSIAPLAAQQLPDVGYMRQLNVEGILALKPTKVISSDVAQPSVVFEQLKSAGVTVERVPFEYTPESVIQKIQRVGKLVNKPQQAVKLAEKFANELKAVSTSPLDVRILFILNHAGSNYMTAGKNTVADSIIRLIGATNAMQNSIRFSPISQEGVIAARPDLLVLTKMSLESLGSIDKVWSLPGMALTPAAKKKNVIVLDDLAVLGFTLTTPTELLKMRQAAEQVRHD
ncbi:ABC transporter substrate-binding protein [Actinobacillus equuli subsp. haemolyticus]|uniref:heme/hemin ABC transporter substrate-binding protein n=1 Tax=Actinobacillus equuli TaxID=718 RepID=UPI002442D5CD|nr:ABC transporter substrate-binding protein [Actinobacillus equuli]WGE46215.1 ABC transporter substrate-binding protein [Actinobacillus equuli subsp. haemolyticus]WGE58813.1 ABC transporter substrate-binding protein [Actinobacillus equuli subsp. haemolyticus]WGE60590.1 ABC transporter substrate-binding protein [Actinobacillus equuli subsp. haemolyticus]WGE62843.1 ABC transporter substrate-binding protein [Actinobacillus equuli subsp. haemolyticus]WGE79075.1 ABC transporter substrate-binding p